MNKDPIIITGPKPGKRPFTPNRDEEVQALANKVIANWARLRFPEIPPEATDIQISRIVYATDEKGYDIPGFEILWHCPTEPSLVANGWPMRVPNQLEFAASLDDVLPEIIAVATAVTQSDLN